MRPISIGGRAWSQQVQRECVARMASGAAAVPHDLSDHRDVVVMIGPALVLTLAVIAACTM